jgi:hypothetical protein
MPDNNIMQQRQNTIQGNDTKVTSSAALSTMLRMKSREPKSSTDDTTSLLKAIKESIVTGSRMSGVLETLKGHSQPPFSNIDSAVKMTGSSFFSKISSFSNKERTLDAKFKKNSETSKKHPQEKKNEKEPSGTGGISENFIKIISEEAGKIFKHSFKSESDFGAFAIASVALNDMFLKVGKWSMHDADLKTTPIDSAIRSIDLLKKFDMTSSIISFLTMFNDKELTGMFQPGAENVDSSKDVTESQMFSIFNSKSGIPLVFNGISSIFKSLGEIKSSIFKTALILKMLPKIGIGKAIKSFYREIKGVKVSSEQLDGISVITELSKTILMVDDISLKAMFSFKKFAVSMKVLKPGKVLGSFASDLIKHMNLAKIKVNVSDPKIDDSKTLMLDPITAVSTVMSEMGKFFDSTQNLIPKASKSKMNFMFINKLGIGKSIGKFIYEIVNNLSRIGQIKEFDTLVEQSANKTIFQKISDVSINFKKSIIGESGFFAIIDSLPKPSVKALITMLFVRKQVQLQNIQLRGIVTDFLKTATMMIDSEKLIMDMSIGFSRFSAFGRQVNEFFDQFTKSLTRLSFSVFIFNKGKKQFDVFPTIFSNLITGIQSVFSNIDDIKVEKDTKTGESIHKGTVSLCSTLHILAKSIRDFVLVAPFIKIAIFSAGMLNTFIEKINKISLQAKSIFIFSTVAKSMMKSLMFLAIGLLTASAIFSRINLKGLIIGTIMIPAYMYLFKMLGSGGNVKAVDMASVVITKMSKALLWFSLTMAIASLAFAGINIGSLMIGFGLLVMSFMIFKFLTTGKSEKEIMKGALLVSVMALSFLIFSGFMLLSSRMLENTNKGMIVLGLLLVAGTGLIFGLLGMAFSYIIKGGLAVLVMSIALLVFTFAIDRLSKSLDGWSFEKFGMAALVIGGLGAITLLLGLPAVFPMVMLGSVAMILMSAALIVFSVGLKMLLSIKYPDEKQQKNMSGTLMSLILPVAALGALSPLILLGSIAMGSMGMALTSISEGIKSTLKIPWQSVPVDSIAKVITTLAAAFASVTFSGGILGSIFGGLSALIPFGISKSPVEKGIDSVQNANRALLSVGQGLKDFDSLTRSLDLRTDSNGKPMKGSLMERISMVLGAVNKVFADIGASGNDSFSLMKLVFGNDFKKSDTEVGIKSVFKTGEALKSVGQGLLEFDNFTKQLDLRTDSSGKPFKGSLMDKIAMVIGSVNKVFSEIGKSGNDSFSLMKFVFGNDFKKSDTEVGIDSVMKTGQSLKSVAQGLKDFDTFTNQLDLSMDNGKPKSGSLLSKIIMVVSAINSAFGEIGKSKNEGSSWLKAAIGIDFKQSDVENGISAVKDVGQVFTDIAKGLSEWQKLETKNIPINLIKNNIKSILSVISGMFGEIGAKKMGGFLGFGSSNVVEDGIKAVKDVGNVFVSIAKGISEWKALSDKGFKGDDFNPEGNGVAGNIKKIMTMVSNIFASIGNTSVAINDRDGNKVGSRYVSEGVKRGIDSIKGAGTELKNIADSVNVFAQLTGKLNIEKTKLTIKTFVLLVSEVFSEIGKMSNDSVKKGVDSIKGAGNELSGILKMLEPFKAGKDSKQFRMDVIKTTIKEMVSLAIDIISGVGGDQERWKKLYPNSKPPTMDFLKNGNEILAESNKGFKEVQEIANFAKSINLDEWNKKKGVIRELAITPVNVMKELSDVYASAKSGIGDVLSFIPNMTQELTQISETTNAIKLGSGKQNTIQTLSNDFSYYIKLVKSNQLSKQQLDNMNMIVSFMERYSKIETPFEKFAKTFKDHVKDFKEFANIVNSIKLDQLKSYNEFTRLSIEMVKTPPSELEQKKDFLYNFVKTFFAEASNMFTQQLQVLQQNYTNAGQNMGGNGTQPQQVVQQQTNNNDGYLQQIASNTNVIKEGIMSGKVKFSH